MCLLVDVCWCGAIDFFCAARVKLLPLRPNLSATTAWLPTSLPCPSFVVHVQPKVMRKVEISPLKSALSLFMLI